MVVVTFVALFGKEIMSRSRKPRNKSGMVAHGRSAGGEHVSSKSIGNDFTDGHRGMARAVKGAKKFVRSRVRAKEKISLRNEELKF